MIKNFIVISPIKRKCSGLTTHSLSIIAKSIYSNKEYELSIDINTNSENNFSLYRFLSYKEKNKETKLIFLSNWFLNLEIFNNIKEFELLLDHFVNVINKFFEYEKKGEIDGSKWQN